ncbi:MAG: family 43 glycosylhydrolase [Terracidiphilus sp.]
MKLCHGASLALFACLVTGCGGGGASSGSGSGGGSSSQTPDMGTLTSMNDSVQYTLTNASSSMVLSIAGQSQTAGADVVQEPSGTTTADIDWHVIPMNNNQFNVENMLTHQVMGVNSASTSAGAQVLQWADNGTADHLWEFYLLKDANYLVKNVNSGLYLEDANSGATSSATIDQGARATTGTGCSCQEWTVTSTGNSPYPAPATVNVSYVAPDSPIIGIHDPSILDTGAAYDLFSTHGLIHEHQSTDMINFTDGGYALPALPAWTNPYTGSSGDLWAPDVSEHNGEYWMYYAASGFGGTYSAIGLAISSTGQPGTFIDSGSPVYTSADCPGSNAIDPASVVDTSGNAWMAFGSWSSGIQIVPVNNTTGIPTGAACVQLAFHSSGAGIEGSVIYPHGGYYYLFASADTCCQGVTSTYRIVVGRATAITGPYTDRGGIAMTSGGGTILLSAHGNIDGPGGESVFTGTSGAVLVYHYYDGNNNGDPALGINDLGWTSDNWPYVE